MIGLASKQTGIGERNGQKNEEQRLTPKALLFLILSCRAAELRKYNAELLAL
jgi:hypothetical protein